MRHESGTRIEEYAHDDRNHGKRKNIDIQQVLLYHDGEYHGEEYD